MATVTAIERKVILPYNNETIASFMNNIRNFVANRALSWYIVDNNVGANYVLVCVLSQADDTTALAWLQNQTNWQGLGLTAAPPTWSSNCNFG